MKYLKITNNGIINIDNIKDIASSSKRYKYIINKDNINKLIDNQLISRDEAILLNDNLLNHVYYNETDLKIDSYQFLNINDNSNLQSFHSCLSNTTIGKYGTGLKQAYCYFLRENIKFIIYSGIEKISISKVKRLSDNVYSDFVCVNNIQTDLNIAFGIEDYNLPMSISEIWTNAIDEGAEDKTIVDETDILGVIGKTSFFIELTDSLKQFLDSWDKYFSFNRTDIIYQEKNFKIFKKEDNTYFDELIVYRRGIQVYTYNRKSIFQYQLDDIEITGSRVIKDRSTLDYRIYLILASKSTEEVIDYLTKSLNKDNNTYEYHLNWDWYDSFNDNWSKVLGKDNIKIVEYSKEEFYNITPKSSDLLYSLPSSMVSSIMKKPDIKHLNGNTLHGNKAGIQIDLSEQQIIYKDYLFKSVQSVLNKDYSIIFENCTFIKSEKNGTNIFNDKENLYINVDYLNNYDSQNIINEIIISLHKIESEKNDNELINLLANTIQNFNKSLSNFNNVYYCFSEIENNEFNFYYYDENTKKINSFILNESDTKYKLEDINFSDLPYRQKEYFNSINIDTKIFYEIFNVFETENEIKNINNDYLF